MRDRMILQCDLGHQPPQTNTHLKPSPTRSSPGILSRGFGGIRLFLEPSGGVFDKRAPSTTEPPLGIGPEDLGQLWLVAYTGSQPLGICQTDSHPPTPGLSHPCRPCIFSLLLSKADRPRFFIFGMACHGSGRNASLTLDLIQSCLTECNKWIYGSKWRWWYFMGSCFTTYTHRTKRSLE